MPLARLKLFVRNKVAPGIQQHLAKPLRVVVPVKIAAFDAIAFDHWLVDLMMMLYAYHQSQIGQPWVQYVACFRMRQGKVAVKWTLC